MSREAYEQVIAELDANPEGRLYHAGYGDDDVQMFEVWDSRERFDAHRDRLATVLQGACVDAGTIEVHELHSPQPD
jgi:hypothetical protein